MPVLIFLLDTSASMNQRTYLGTSALDLAKGAVETFLKLRARDPASRGDRYMLVSCDDPPATVKAGWKENHATFMTELKNLQPTGLTTLGASLKQTFDLLNVNRLHSGIDNYGQGRNPFFLEPAMVIAVTDGHKLVNASGVQGELALPMMNAFAGSELTKEPFRWDQRLFALVLRMGGVPSLDTDKDKTNNARTLVNVDDSPITAMCEVTGGRSYTINSLKTLNQCLESLAQKVQSGVVVNLEKYGPEPEVIDSGKLSGRKSPISMETETTANGYLHTGPFLNGTKRVDNESDKLSLAGNPRLNTASPIPQDTSWHSCRRLICVRPNSKTGLPVGHWPVPESFWPDINAPTLPPRDSQPILKFTCTDSEPLVLDNLPFDKYELEPSPLTQYILERRNPNVGWQVFVSSSGKTGNELGHPFGYLKASSNLSCVNLVIMPYNYPVLLPLLDDLFKVHKLKPSIKWRQAFDNYLRDVPNYYAQPLRVALRRMGAPNLIPDGMENCLSYSVVTYLKKLKQQSKVETERLAALISKKLKPAEQAGVRVQPRSQLPSLAARKDFQHLLRAITGETVTVRADNNITEFPGFMLRLTGKDIKLQKFRNAFDIPRSELLDQVQRMRTNFLQLPSSKSGRLMNEHDIHSIKIAEMGNYQEYLKTMPSPLRDVEEGPSRLHTFGNPFKLASEKDKRMMVDEADVNEAMTGPARRRSESPSPRRRNSASSPPSRQPTSPGAQDSILRKTVAELRQSTLDKQKAGLQASPPEPKPPEPVEESLDDTVLVVDETGGDERVGIVEGSDSPTIPNHVDSEDTENGASEKPNNLDLVEIGSAPKNKERNVNGHNHLLKKTIIREVRKPGKNFTKLFDCLRTIKGDLDTKYLFINAVIYEASRFKRRVLIDKLEAFQRNMMVAQDETTPDSTSSGGSAAKSGSRKRPRNHSVDPNGNRSTKKAKPR